jgi:hypothetical protein
MSKGPVPRFPAAREVRIFGHLATRERGREAVAVERFDAEAELVLGCRARHGGEAAAGELFSAFRTAPLRVGTGRRRWDELHRHALTLFGTLLDVEDGLVRLVDLLRFSRGRIEPLQEHDVSRVEAGQKKTGRTSHAT